ncbi:MAG: glycosyltransferase [Clostridia bacterium]|nr:glycosyltransferase [Clostridia bacterium]
MANKRLTDLVSVVMPVYNGAAYLREAIESILNQTYGNFEFIIIDDGSTDDSCEIIRSFQDTRIIYVKNEHNLGISASLNKALGLAKANYIARLDCDDIASPNRLEVQLRYMKKNQDIGICGSWVQYFGIKKGVMTYPIYDQHIKAFLNFRNAFAHPSVMMRKSVFENYPICYSANSVIEDFKLWSQCANYTKFHNIPMRLTSYRIVESSLSHDPQKQKRIMEAYYKLVDENLKSNFKIDITARQILVHSADINVIRENEIKIQEVLDWLNYLNRVNAQKKVYNQSAMHAMLSYRWYEICSAYSFEGLRTFSKYFFCRYNGLWHRPWHVLRLFLLCLRKAR